MKRHLRTFCLPFCFRPLLTLIVAAGVFAAVPASASDLRLMGGMGLTTWPMQLDLGARRHEGLGLGITGRLMLRLFDHVRFQAGLLQGEWGEDDLSAIKRSLIFGGVEARMPLYDQIYATAGVRAGGAHLLMQQTQGVDDDGRRLVRDFDRWSPVIEPMAALGWLVADKFHFEIELGAALDFVDGGMRVSPVVLAGVYFRMMDRSW